ncbi:thioesterase family protein [Nocardia higoensis]|uniref:Thioesterase family protein n=1 Tax=Nocardia higoensis TaxID=228599 RepID=A0ABS0D3H2_9NOCA|nr:acyl-CoA thioesterase domain-containing protein [Nocardia higoensis]MBF6353037.1 thioesterase family protein [Nocardia higoensis]
MTTINGFVSETTGSGAAARVVDLSDALAALDLTRVDADRFRATSLDLGFPRLFGGQLLAQALVAATHTVDSDMRPHSLHASFLSGGDADKPLDLVVTRLRDGRRMARRQVVVEQGGRGLMTAIVSAATDVPGLEHQDRMPDVPAPPQCPTIEEWTAPWGGLTETWVTTGLVELRIVPEPIPDRTMVWLRAEAAMPDDQLLHQAMTLLMSDITALSAGLAPHGVPVGGEHLGEQPWDGVSIDHAMWFHRPARADGWLLYVQRSPSAFAGRGLIVGEVFDESGRCVGSFTQEGLYFPDIPEQRSE